MSNKRIRGVAIHRSLLIGSTSTPLTPAEKLLAPPDHTHKWTVAVRSAASHPLPSLATISGLSAANGLKNGDEVSPMAAAGASVHASPTAGQSTGTTATSGTSGSIGTRGRDHEFDYHRLVGGRDDISHFVRRVQFKLHDTYTQPTRNIDKPPFSVTETGWGEFEIQIKIFFVPEANEKPVTLFHHLKLHPWLNQLAPPSESSAGLSADSSSTAASSAPSEDVTAATASADVVMADAANTSTATTEAASGHVAARPGTAAAPAPVLPPVVHSWQYDEVVFPEPTEAFYEILIAHPPTPLPPTSAQAFADPSAYRSYQSALEDEASARGASASKKPLLPPHPLHAPTGFLFDALSQEAQQEESDRLDMARISAVKELEKGRERLIKAERALKETRSRINALSNAAGAATTSGDNAASTAVLTT